MKPLEGMPLETLPVSDLRHVRDLIYYDGPLLSHFCSHTGDDYLFYWVDCDEKANRWMVCRVGEAMILRLLNRFVPLNLVLPAGSRDDFVYFVDYGEDDATVAAHLVMQNAIPDDYLPRTGVYLETEPSTRSANSYSLLVEGGWSVKALGDFPHTFAKVYSLLYGLNVLRIPSFEGFPWRGGFSAVHFFNWVAHQIPAESKPVVSAMQYSSPGFMRFSLHGATADQVSHCVNDYKTKNTSISAAFSDLATFIRENKLNDDHVTDEQWQKVNPTLSDKAINLISALGVVDAASFERACPRPFEAAKIAMSFYRYIRKLNDFEKNGLVRFPRPL